ncbi:hypothetical protein EB796_007088 [Bugula neritina]|uniref:E3 ubiquitin-protein ligase n=1 Tax=Bugula neritina TaxID=10212 RepID=A0A7J7KAG9_BUGNE|nr:hypothetical protein EB796_007088 [Bugula neritina]
MDKLDRPQALPCSHKFCKDCLDQVKSTSKSNLCPVCRVPFAVAEGKQPKNGTMSYQVSRSSLPGHSGSATITINYSIPWEQQGHEHPYPGQPYSGTRRTAYLPDNTKGRQVLKLLEKAFKHRLVFTVGQSVTSGMNNTVVWNDIHHKTSPTGGPSSYGYPDPGYLDRVIEDLKAKGITE